MKKILWMIISVLISTEAFATDCNEGYIKGVNTGNCIKASGGCGSGCTYTIDAQGNVEVNGTGELTSLVFHGNNDVKNVTINEGIKKNRLEYFASRYYNKRQNCRFG